MLPGQANGDGPCANPGVRLIASDAELEELYESLGVEPGTSDYPSVDFSRERVVVNETSRSEGVQWAVREGDTLVVGLLGCGLVQTATCVTQAIAVPSAAASVESRRCTAVRCGQPPITPRRP